MTKILHILNGDSTKHIFDKNSIQGDTVIWREMLCEGSLVKDIGSDKFWVKRYDFFEKKVGISRLDYYDKTIKEIIKLQDISDYNEVVLWFEYDLFCQVNLMALCSYLLKSYRKDILYYLVCTGEEKGKSQLQTLADYSPEEYETLYQNKIKLSRNDLLFAEKALEVYVANDKEELNSFDFSKNKKFKYLLSTMQQHLQRFPGENGLNQIENKILNLIHSGVSSKNEIIKTLLIWQKEETVYGFGDLQYEIYLKNLKSYYSVNENSLFSLNQKGENALRS
ncbi:MAG: DUF1835 domain-containing protein [Bacteroidota bacterium]